MPLRARSASALLLSSLLTVGVVGPGASATAADQPPSDASGRPSLEQMNDARDHALGSTLPDFEPGSASPDGGGLSAQALSQRVLGMDVSGWQPTVDWNSAWANGARFVYIKATESNDYASGSFSGQYSGATAVGMIRGAYHFANPHESTGAVQANYFVDHGGGWTADGRTLPPMLDVEYNPYGSSNHVDSCWGLSQAEMVAWIADFSSTVRNRTGIRPVIYTTTGWWKLCTGDNSSFGSNPLFIANWNGISGDPGGLPASWKSYALWQYAADGVFPGDQDLYNGDYTALRRFAANGTPPAGGTTLDSNYITALYYDYLGRMPSAADVAWWENTLATGAPRDAIAGGFVNSDEYRLIRIDAAYQGILGRPAEPSGRASWLRAMQAGAITTDDIETEFYASQEYYLQHGGTDRSFVAALYQTLLHRSGTSSDYDFWAGLIAQHDRSWVIDQFWDSTETISERVSAMYARYLGRVPDAGGLKGWVGLALQLGDSGLRAGLTSSDEYFARAQTRTY